jgi:hypothetical protein
MKRRNRTIPHLARTLNRHRPTEGSADEQSALDIFCAALADDPRAVLSSVVSRSASQERDDDLAKAMEHVEYLRNLASRLPKEALERVAQFSSAAFETYVRDGGWPESEKPAARVFLALLTSIELLETGDHEGSAYWARKAASGLGKLASSMKQLLGAATRWHSGPIALA